MMLEQILFWLAIAACGWLSLATDSQYERHRAYVALFAVAAFFAAVALEAYRGN